MRYFRSKRSNLCKIISWREIILFKIIDRWGGLWDKQFAFTDLQFWLGKRMKRIARHRVKTQCVH